MYPNTYSNITATTIESNLSNTAWYIWWSVGCGLTFFSSPLISFSIFRKSDEALASSASKVVTALFILVPKKIRWFFFIVIKSWRYTGHSLFICELQRALYGIKCVLRIFWQTWLHILMHIFSLHIVNTFSVTHLHTLLMKIFLIYVRYHWNPESMCNKSHFC